MMIGEGPRRDARDWCFKKGEGGWAYHVVVCSTVFLEDRHGFGDVLEVLGFEIGEGDAFLARDQECAVGNRMGTHDSK